LKAPVRTKVADLELTDPPAVPDGLDGYDALRLLVRLHGVPVGHVELSLQGSIGACLTASGLRKLILHKLDRNIVSHHVEDALESGLPPEGLDPRSLPDVPHPDGSRAKRDDRPLVTVAVCTRDRANDLKLCLDSLSRLDYPHLDIVVVDNAPTTGATESLVGSYPRVRYAREDRPGLDWARNRAIVEARGEFLAYTDDDVIVDPGWVSALVAAFEDPEVAAVTGLVAPYELETEAQVLFERYGGFGRGYRRRYWRMDREAGEGAYQFLGAGQYGTGANMAYRTAVFQRIGPFDPALDVGTATNGGGDLEMFFRVIREGYTLAYEPAAVVRHRHRREYERLKTQLENNGIGFYSHLVRCALAYPDARVDAVLLGLWWLWWWSLRRLAKSFLKPRTFPRDLILAEVWGSFKGLSRYSVARARAARIAAETGTELPEIPPTPKIPHTAGPEPPGKKARGRKKTVGVRLVDLREPDSGLTDVGEYDETRVFAAFDGRPVGDLLVANKHQPVGAVRLRTEVVGQIGLAALGTDPQFSGGTLWEEAREALRKRYLPPEGVSSNGMRYNSDRLPDGVSASVVVATRDRPEDLRACLASLVAQETTRPVEVIVVDNNPASGLTPSVTEGFPEVRTVSEARKGLSYARNKGFAASRGEVVISTDDDVVVPPDWLEKLLAPFDRPDVMVVTGNVLPAELLTAAQRDFERYGALGRGYAPKVADGVWFRWFKDRAVPTWELGATANAAFRADIFADPEIGLLEESLGAGTPTGCSEDTYLFYKVLRAGYAVAYEPSAYAWHRHRREADSLRRQIHNYSKGHVAYHLLTLVRDGDRRALRDLLLRLPRWHVKNLARYAKRRILRRERYPLRLILAEISGNLAGPFALVSSLRRVKREGKSAPYLRPSERSNR
jgi:glycosyltransferase involved in cell wall biosynthesis